MLLISKEEKRALGAKRIFPFILVFIGSSLYLEKIGICLVDCKFYLVHSLLLWVGLSKLSSAPGSAVVSWLTFTTSLPQCVPQFCEDKIRTVILECFEKCSSALKSPDS